MLPQYTTEDLERFWSKIEKTDNENSCWIWIPSVLGRKSGSFSVKGIRYSAAKFSWMIHNPDRQNIENPRVFHLCENYRCVNPDHLALQTDPKFLDALINRFWQKVNKIDDPEKCWEWKGTFLPDGYGQMYWLPKEQDILAHRLSWMLTYGEIDDGLIVRHNCDNPACVRPSHLQLGTYLDNSRDMVERRRNKRGEQRPEHILTERNVIEMRKSYADGLISQRGLAKKFGVSRSTVWHILKGKSWKWLD